MNKITAEQKKVYLNDSNKCPFCRSRVIEGGLFDVGNNNTAYHYIHCHNCKHSWRDEYKLKSVSASNKMLWD